MTLEMRKERALLHKELNDLLTKCDNDAQYFRRLTWALEFISNNIDRFDIMIDDRYNILVEGDKD
jgi:hypothetical protein